MLTFQNFSTDSSFPPAGRVRNFKFKSIYFQPTIFGFSCFCSLYIFLLSARCKCLANQLPSLLRLSNTCMQQPLARNITTLSSVRLCSLNNKVTITWQNNLSFTSPLLTLVMSLSHSFQRKGQVLNFSMQLPRRQSIS